MKKHPSPRSKKQQSPDESLNQGRYESTNEGLAGCVSEIFPKIKPDELNQWIAKTQAGSIDPDPILFIALVCGAHFRSLPPEDRLKKTLAYLFDWLVRGDDQHRMSPDVAEMVVDALTPGIRKKIKKGGHQIGLPEGRLSRKRGRIPDTRGAWVAAAVVETYLIQKRIKKTAPRDHALRLVSLLLNKKEKSAQVELNRFYTNTPNNAIADLTEQLTQTYKLWVKQDGANAGDYEPPKNQTDEHSKWKSQHKSHQYVIKQWGCEQYCNVMLGYIKNDLWKRLWDIKIK